MLGVSDSSAGDCTCSDSRVMSTTLAAKAEADDKDDADGVGGGADPLMIAVYRAIARARRGDAVSAVMASCGDTRSGKAEAAVPGGTPPGRLKFNGMGHTLPHAGVGGGGCGVSRRT